jgi:phthalate 4,5-dioxygenase
MNVDSELLTRVGPGTPMGHLMRQYWVPAALSSEVAVDGPPLRLKLLGENLIAFRDTSGRVGVLDHRCPHRCASLFFGRNEHNGIRCVYHGWKFDVTGQCLETANLPNSEAVRSRVKVKAYRVREKAGLIWVYMGRRQTAPELPQWRALDLPSERLSVWAAQRHCNYLQALEGDLDTSHVGFLHGGLAEVADPTVTNRAPNYKVVDTECGVMYAAHRPADERHTIWRYGSFSMPFWTQPPPAPLGSEVAARAWVPMDDTHTMLFSISSDTFVLANRPNASQRTFLGGARGIMFDYEYLENTTDWYGRWRLKANSGNDYFIDREIQRNASFTGIEGLEIQDTAITESMGPITDHALEHLTPSDLMVARTRQRLLRAAVGLRDHNTAPPGVDQPAAYSNAWGGFIVADSARDWLEIFQETTTAADR